MSTAETRVNRRNTVAFIKERPVSVVLTPFNREKTGSGGRQWTAGAPRTSQVFRLIDQSSGAQPARDVAQRNEDGTSYVNRMVLLGTWDAVWARHDRFTIGDAEYEITELIVNNDYERRAEVQRYGGS